MKYRQYREVEAVQITDVQSGIASFTGEPKWLTNALAGASGYAGSIWVLGSNVLVGTNKGISGAEAGDYIILDREHGLQTMTSQIFESSHEQVNEED